jgi:hypothetical protein
MARPQRTKLEIREVGELQTTSKGNCYVECKTDVGVVAFWGKTDHMGNIQAIQRTVPPLKAICGCIPSNWNQHALWVPESASIQLLDPSR